MIAAEAIDVSAVRTLCGLQHFSSLPPTPCNMKLVVSGLNHNFK